MSITSQEYRVVLDKYRTMVEAGFHPIVAESAVLRALDRTMDAGMGKVHQLRRLDRENFPELTPRRSSGRGCETITETPGDENRTLVRIQELESQGYNVIRTEPYKGHVVYYACQPGYSPNEAQPLVLQAEGM